MRLAGKNAIVTGAGSGIGRAIAERLGEEGAAVAVADINADAGARTAQGLSAKGVRAINIPTDVSDPSRLERLVATAVSSLDRLDIFINNAGINFVKPMIATSVEDWNRVITTDLGGTFFGCKYAIEQFLRQGSPGCIVNISSVHSVATFPESAPYAAAKGGISMLTKSLAIEFGLRGIRVNSVCPGATATQIWEDIKTSSPEGEKILQHIRSNIAMGREGTPQEIANFVVWLCTDEASYVTGANLVIDGGMTAMLAGRME
jgi:NAD(P)-dependent dehydrogenase (short-subunit alcohol dehydrogenase family)